MIDALQTSASGLSGAFNRLANAAEQIARIDAGPSGTSLPEAASIELTPPALAAIEARNAGEANAAVMSAAAQSADRLLDVRV